nr:hypothetical protein [Sphingomonas aliaeris]
MKADASIMDAPIATNRRFSVTPFVELLVLGVALAIAVGSYFLLRSSGPSQNILTPPLVAFLLVANLLPDIALLVLLGRRIAVRRAARSPIGGARDCTSSSSLCSR